MFKLSKSVKMYSYRYRNSSLKVENLAYGSNYRSIIVARTREMPKLRFTNHNTDLKEKKPAT